MIYDYEEDFERVVETIDSRIAQSFERMKNRMSEQYPSAVQDYLIRTLQKEIEWLRMP